MPDLSDTALPRLERNQEYPYNNKERYNHQFKENLWLKEF